MRAVLERSGGFAGMRVTSSADMSILSPDEAELFQRLVKQADFFTLPESITSKKPQPDRFQYKLTVEDGELLHTVTVGEEVMPASLRPLVDWLVRRPRRGNPNKT